MRHSSPARSRKSRTKPLDSQGLETLALHYLSRFATSRAKLARYLDRKVKERGWEGESAPDIEGIVARCARARYVDDAAYAAMRGRDLAARGYGPQRLRQRLYADGIAEDEAREALDAAEQTKVDAALAFAARRRLGPYAASPPADEKARQRALSAMMRAGHELALAKAILARPPGEEVEPADFLDL